MSGGWLKRVLSQALQADHEEEQTGEVSGLHQLPLCRHCISLGNLVVFAGAVVRLRDAGRHRHGQHQERGGDDGASAVAVRGLQAFGGCGRVMHRRPGTMRKKNLPCISVSMHSWLRVTSSSLSWLFVLSRCSSQVHPRLRQVRLRVAPVCSRPCSVLHPALRA